MNLTRILVMQHALDKRIEKEHPCAHGEDRIAKKILALQVELGELANEWRGFKFWSNDQEPRAFEPNPNDVCKECNGQPIFYEGNDTSKKMIGQCDYCDGCGVHFHNPLLEEYVDCLHFILSIGLDLNLVSRKTNLTAYQESSIINQFIELSSFITELFYNRGGGEWIDTVQSFLGLGEMLGFTWEQIEQAYISKNEVNHERQSNGY